MGSQPGKDDLIREAAIRVFSRKGFYEAKMEEVAQEAGVAVGTIYNYYASKEDLLLSIFTEEFEDWARFYEEFHSSGLPVQERIHRLLDRRITQHKEHSDLALVLLRERFSHGGGFQERLLAFYREMMERIEGFVEEAVAEGWLRPCNPRIVAHALFALVEVTSALLLAYPEEESGRFLKEASQELGALIWQGLRKEEG